MSKQNEPIRAWTKAQYEYRENVRRAQKSACDKLYPPQPRAEIRQAFLEQVRKAGNANV